MIIYDDHMKGVDTPMTRASGIVEGEGVDPPEVFSAAAAGEGRPLQGPKGALRQLWGGRPK